MTHTQPNVTFISVHDNAQKLDAIYYVVQKHFMNEESIHIAVPNAEAAEYVDNLLWRYPPESFIPHVVTMNATEEKIVISTKEENLNRATILLNLCTAPPAHFREFKIIYELHDETHPSKTELSRQRKTFYGTQNCVVAS